MSLAEGQRAKFVKRYWIASSAWKGAADGWTYGEIIQECKYLAEDSLMIGLLADRLLDDIVYDRRRRILPVEETSIIDILHLLPLHRSIRPKSSVFK